MKILRLILILIVGVLLFMVMRLPDSPSRDEGGFANIPAADFRRLAAAQWQTDQPGRAVLLLNYSIENDLPDAEACAGARDGYLAVMRSDRTLKGRLAEFGLDQLREGAGDFAGLSGATVADWVVAEGTQTSATDDDFGAQLEVARKLTELFPPAAPALRLADAAWRGGILRSGLKLQLARALQVACDSESSGAIVAVQETIMPLLQLARQCRTWAEYTTLLERADSVDQVKLLARMASLTPLNSGRLARPLIVAEADNRSDLIAQIMDFAARRGQIGLDALDIALRRGTSGLEYLLQHPDMPVAVLAATRPDAWPPAEWRVAWRKWVQHVGWPALAVKFAVLSLLCFAVLICLLPPSLLSSTDGTARRGGWYWPVSLAAGLAVGALLMLSGRNASPATQPGLSGGGLEGVTAVSTSFDLSRMASWLVILTAILLAQGACWELARRKIRAVTDDQKSSPALKLKQLENLDIFFDLPLYTGLAMTILAFILISILGAGVSRFLAYASTFVGILFAVALRIGYLYPLREKLLSQNGK